jgi:hypothetical protein
MHEGKADTITIRVTKNQKERLRIMAGGCNISAFVLGLIKQENQRQINERLHGVFDDDDIPF